MDKALWLEDFKERVPEAAEAVADPKYVRAEDVLHVKVPPGRLAEAAVWLKEKGFDLLNFLTAVDYVKEGRFELVYHFMKSGDLSSQVFLKADVERDGDPGVPSIAPHYAAADWQERETYDLFGIRFEGHPHHRRILLWEGYPGWPLRKDYVHTPDKYDNGFEIGLPKAPARGAIP
jgi:NADH:ubiquinone oxidoreductase subunit C